MKKFKEFFTEETKDESNTVELNVPLFIRLLEYAREDAKKDVDLHFLTERLVNLKRCATMDDYEELVKD